MPGFAPSNPYGSFFNFADPAVMAQQSFTANPAGTLSPGTLSAMGSPVGGFNPSLAEFTAARSRDVAYQQFISRSLATDPTTRTFSNVAMDMLFKDRATRQAAAAKYGQGNIDAMVGMALNMPGVSQFFGGSARSLALGSLAAGTSGMRWNNTGMFGDGQVQIAGAGKVLDMVRQNFYTSSGAQRLDMTQGLNKDQIGAILAAGGSQGAFAGLDIGSISSKGKMSWNEGSLDKIKDFTKSAAKAISGLIDIYGDANFNELYDKAQRITGMDLSRLSNAGIIQQRLGSLRTTAQVSGVDVQTLNDMSAGAVNYGSALGFSRSSAGAVAASVMGQAAWTYQMSRQSAGAFFSPDRSLGSIVAEQTRDRFGMIRDPLGARRNAVELLIQEGVIHGGDVSQARAMAADATPATTGSLDAMISSKYGVHLPSMIRRMGGADSLFDRLTDENKMTAVRQNESDLQRRFGTLMTRNMTGILRDKGAGDQVGNFQKLMGNLDPKTVFSLLGAVDAGDDSKALSALIGKDAIGQTDIAGYLGAAQAIGKALPGGARGAWNLMRDAQMANDYTRNMLSTSEQTQRSRQMFQQFGSLDATHLAALRGVAMGARGQFRGGLLQGFLDRFGGTDPASVLAVAMSTAEGQNNITGRLRGKEWMLSAFDLSPQNLTSGNGVGTLEALRASLKGIPGGKEALEAAGLMERGFDKKITEPMAAAFATHYATDPLNTLPGMVAIGTPRGAGFANNKYLQAVKEGMGGLNTITKLKGYFDNGDFMRNSSSPNKSALRDSLSRQLGKMQDSFLGGKLKSEDIYQLLKSEAFIANIDPEALSVLARADSRFASQAQDTVVHMKEGGDKNKRLEALADVLANSGGMTGGYSLVGSVVGPEGEQYNVTNIKLEPTSKKN